MDEKLLDWASEKFGDELKKVPSSTLFGALLTILLLWAADAGEYKSALLGLIHLTPSDMTDDARGLGKLPLIAYLASAIGAIGLYGFLQLIGKWYFRFVCQTKLYVEKLDLMVRENRQLGELKKIPLLSELQSAQANLAKKRLHARKWVEVFYWLILSGTALIGSSIRGNVFDAAIGTACVIVGLWSLFRSVGVFIMTVTPWYARVEALTELITSNLSDQSQVS